MNMKLFSLTNSFEKVRRNVRFKDDMMASCGDHTFPRFRNKNKIFHQYIASMLIKSYQLETRCILVMDIGVAQQRWNGATAEKLENKTNSRNRCCVSVHRAYMFSTCPVNVCERFYLNFFPRSVEWKLVFADNIANDDVCVQILFRLRALRIVCLFAPFIVVAVSFSFSFHSLSLSVCVMLVAHHVAVCSSHYAVHLMTSKFEIAFDRFHLFGSVREPMGFTARNNHICGSLFLRIFFTRNGKLIEMERERLNWLLWKRPFERVKTTERNR